jgi:hypothetical protein
VPQRVLIRVSDSFRDPDKAQEQQQRALVEGFFEDEGNAIIAT